VAVQAGPGAAELAAGDETRAAVSDDDAVRPVTVDGKQPRPDSQ